MIAWAFNIIAIILIVKDGHKKQKLLALLIIPYYLAMMIVSAVVHLINPGITMGVGLVLEITVPFFMFFIYSRVRSWKLKRDVAEINAGNYEKENPADNDELTF